MKNVKHISGFTLIELLVVVAIIALLVSIIMPSLSSARELAKNAKCLAGLRSLSNAAGIYQAENDGNFWPYSMKDTPSPGVTTYFWGSDANPVVTSASPFMAACGNSMEIFWCPSFKWDESNMIGKAKEHTSAYAYNGRYLQVKNVDKIPDVAQLFVFSDSALYSSYAKKLLVNYHLEPISGAGIMSLPSNHFRHLRKNNSLSADGHAQSYDNENGIYDESTQLGYVGTRNSPHYTQD